VEYGSCVASDGRAAGCTCPWLTWTLRSSMVALEQMLLLMMLPYMKQKTRVANEAERPPAIAAREVQAPHTIRSCRQLNRD
jgi:hypothetical protein